MQTIEKVLSARTGAKRSSPKVNLTDACSEVVKNKGAGGVDGMSVKELKSYLDNNREELCNTIREGRYIPQPIRGKEIPKRNGKKRLLGIPTVTDRMLQQAVSRLIMPQFEYMFSEYSYGFIHVVFIFRSVHELAPLGSATTEYPANSSEIVGLYQFGVSTHRGDRSERFFRRGRSLLATGPVVPENKMPCYHAVNPQMAKGTHMGKRQVDETEKRRATGGRSVKKMSGGHF